MNVSAVPSTALGELIESIGGASSSVIVTDAPVTLPVPWLLVIMPITILTQARLTATVRYSKGDDIAAGCGQLYQEMVGGQ